MRSEEVLHPGHHSIRLLNRDYAAPGSYFVTICAHEKRCTLGRISNAQIELTPLGKIVRDCWIAIPDHFAHVQLHEFVIMPNHVHGLIGLTNTIHAQSDASKPDIQSSIGVRRGSLSAIVRSFKSAVTKLAHVELAWAGEVWQRNYF